MANEKDPVNAPSRSSVARLLRKNGGYNFKWETTIRPIADALLEMEKTAPEDEPDRQAYKSILKLKKDTISELEAQIDALKEQLKAEKQKYHEKLADETSKFRHSLDFATHQIELKDKRIDQLMDANDRLSITNNKLLTQFLDCPLQNKDCKK